MFCVLCTEFLFRQIHMNASNKLKIQIKKYETKQNYLLLNSYSGYTLRSVSAKISAFSPLLWFSVPVQLLQVFK